MVDMPAVSDAVPGGIVVHSISGAWNYSLHRPLVCLSNWTETYGSRVDSRDALRAIRASREFRLYERSGWFVTGYCSIFETDRRRFARAAMPWFQRNNISLVNGYRGRYGVVYATCQGSVRNYAHWIFDHLAWLVAVPEQFLNESSVAVFGTDRFAESLALLCVARVLFLAAEEYVWADTLYQWDPIPTDWQEPAVLWPLRALLVSKLGLDRARPRVYGVLFREGRWASRRLENLSDWCERWRAEYPGRRWENSTGFRTLTGAGPWFNALRLLFATHGAGCVNILFMQAGSAFGEVLPVNLQPCAYFEMSRMLGLHHVALKKKGFDQFRVHPAEPLLDWEGTALMTALMRGLGEA